jgi:GDP-mannose 6-dehydrogenase
MLELDVRLTADEGDSVRIAIFGLGYVGVVSAACLARDGHDVLGVDPNPVKRDLINQAKSPIVEPHLQELITEVVGAGRLRATDDAVAAVKHADILLICVGTPGSSNGSLDLQYVRRVCQQIGSVLAKEDAYKVVVARSTMLPGSMMSVVIPTLESASGKRAGQHFGVCINPEFLREGTAVHDYDHPPKTVIGANDERAAGPLRELYAKLDAPMIVTELPIAEMVKYADNTWHALKVAFGNEMGRLCKALNVDGRTLMELFVKDTKLNISPTYLRPGFAFGGSCLPKDLRALTYQGRAVDVETPVLSAVLESNDLHIDHAMNMIRATGKRRIGLMGLSFKAGTDDLRESPIVTLAEYLIGKGYELAIYDRNVQLASLVGANKEYILDHIPHISRLMVQEPAQLFAASDVVVLATAEKDFGALAEKHGAGKTLIDLVGVWRLDGLQGRDSYQGIAW